MKSSSNNESLGYIKVSSPSNIAFVKYWGKRDRQLPLNPSLSMTLNECRSFMEITFHKSEEFKLTSFCFEEKENAKFKDRIEEFLLAIKDEYKFLNKLELHIKCSNSFPHSCGIASSASSMSALVYGIMQFEARLKGIEYDAKRASFFSRIASGSASRSLYPHYSIWGEHEEIEDSSNESAIPFNSYHSSFKNLQDAVLVIDKSEKEVSSSQGHILMNAHFFKDLRIEQANENVIALKRAMEEGDLSEFGRILELEALSLHALMMTSDPSYILMKPNSLLAIEKIRQKRKAAGLNIFFTLDAGANLHVIYPFTEKETVQGFIETELKALCEDETVIYDSYGEGPELIEVHFG